MNRLLRSLFVGVIAWCLVISSGTVWASQGVSYTNSRDIVVQTTITVPKSQLANLSSYTIKGTLISGAEHPYANPYYYAGATKQVGIGSDNEKNFSYTISENVENQKITSDKTYTAVAKIKSSLVTYSISPKQVASTVAYPPEVKRYVVPSPQIESNHPLIVKKAKEIVKGETNPYLKVKKIFDFTNTYMEYTEKEAWGTAVQALQRRSGVCEDFSRLMVALLRAQNIPARTVAGYALGKDEKTVDLTKADYAHMWVEFYLPGYGWLPADPTVLDYDEHDKRVAAANFGMGNWYYIPEVIDQEGGISYEYYAREEAEDDGNLLDPIVVEKGEVKIKP
ncbi:transglutaminase superfamily protein [Aneurinibacillus soli]|uniref:Protein-glutamine gamma-glutamyltransferase n=1 Tax=Aneurinibacillus soli TaxID=1500254 RepID=A0A0U4WJ49_9BACL|nr:transglutaminase-like domain-containing protein [Aneurinibacillus soli]PYE62243.1 transglutaminase superfamily protein [Aneurinibacillus soli]BAU28568.1 Protein-glutamine gamma-glutamyltransferase [Aneurinibacillus soli]